MREVLVVEDDARTAYLLQAYLERERCHVSIASDGEQALVAARRQPPDLVLLDLMLPRIDGLELCQMLRELQPRVSIIMVTARTTEDAKLDGLDAGADDYVTKPFSPRELMARVRAALRRTALEPAARLVQIGDLRLDSATHEVRKDERVVPLTPTEFKLLEALASAPGRVFTRSQLADRALGYDYQGLERTVDKHVANLRRKLDSDPGRYIATVHGVGYKLVGDCA